jgi:hypothetical protein
MGAGLRSERKDRRGFDLISDRLPFGWLVGISRLRMPSIMRSPTRARIRGPNAVANAIGYAEHCSRSHHAVIRVYDVAGNVIETHEHKGDFNEP